MENLKILFTTDVSFPEPGGVGRCLYEEGMRLVKKGHTVCILAPAISPKVPQRERMEEIRIYRYRINPRNSWTYFITSILNAGKIFGHIIQEEGIDIIDFQQPLSALGINLIGRDKTIPRVYTFYSPWHLEHEVKTGRGGINSWTRKFIEGKALHNCKKAIVLSRYSRSLLLGIHRFPPSKVEIIPGGVDIDRFKPPENKEAVKLKLGIPKEKLLLFTVRHLTQRMGLENLIRAMAEVRMEDNDVHLIIGGTGPLESKLKQLTVSLGLQTHIEFAGFISDENLLLYYQAADLFILPTKELEGFGLITLEALACGTPVLGTPVGGTIEILEPLDKGFIFEGTDSLSIAGLIKKHLGRREQLIVLGRKCRGYVEKNYLWQTTVEKMEKLFMGVIQGQDVP